MTGQTITEKILARHSGRDAVSPGDTIWVNADVLMTHDVCGPGTIGILKQELGEDARVWDADKVVIIPDHYIFTKDPESNRNVRILREFAKEQKLPHYYDVGTDAYKGVCHVALAEEGHNRPGEVLFGTDSHTCTAGAFGLFATGIGNTDAAFVMGTGKLWLRVPATLHVAYEGEIPAYLTAKDMILALIGSIGVDGATYCALEFVGAATKSMDMAERMTLCNMAIECGAKSGIVPPDDTTIAFVKAHTDRPFEAVVSDADASYLEQHRFDVSAMAPKVARPHSPDNVVDVMELKDTAIDRCYIGSCTGGKTEDFIRAAEIMDGKKVAVDTFCVPATNLVDRDFDTVRRNGRTLREIFEAAGAKLGPPSCAACLGGPIDTFGRTQGSEVCISTTNRNFPGRMGSKDSAVYLASPYTVAASALTGRITDPRNYL
jgi:3-isopropylmalate/(R)-2-methylmalate dehydratase large subunit